MPTYAGAQVTSRPTDVGAIVRLLVLVVVAVCLVVLDSQGGWLSQLRARANVLVQPVWALVGLPSQVMGSVGERMSSQASLVEQNQRLRAELLVANARLARLRAAAVDNTRLRERLGVAERNGLDVQLVPILDVDLDPVRQRLVLAAGSRHGVHVGQAVIDAGGLVGQVIEVTAVQSVVLLLTDPDHAIPVTVARNGVRLIAYGRGARLELRDIPLSAEVEVGDEIVTSALGGRFPPGFPVGKVTTLRPDDSHAFLIGELTPAAKLDRGQDVLLLRSLPMLPEGQTALDLSVQSESDAPTTAGQEPVVPHLRPRDPAVPAATPSASTAAPAPTDPVSDAPATTPAVPAPAESMQAQPQPSPAAVDPAAAATGERPAGEQP
ncbi:rod shape-determining protein MreC [Stenotrophomonas ginsengisoli]|uniref:Cell shape-determining protein MreC n=1 Tax=Stenotrophomonas ginsengisoli TaxID=336566 RepID=A0A0R0D7L6_9GAMM|nr:rod shape-determining protein MreC [Stenotrophomonas ginsengisoli]KRG78284.1 rod shape-determining protein MreC [Stenotrophomonas ginsengisoli]